MSPSTSQSSLIELLSRFWVYIGHRRRWHIRLLAGAILVSAIAEVISLGSVLPFLGVLAAPEQVFEIAAVRAIADWLGVKTAEELVLPLTLGFAGAALFAGAARILVSWASARLTFALAADLSIEIYRRSLYLPYSEHVVRNSSETIAGITGKVGSTSLGVILPTLNLLSSGVLLCALLASLILIEPVVAIGSMSAFGVSYLVITWTARRRLAMNSELIASEQNRVVKMLQEGLGGIRDVILGGLQPLYCKVYEASDRRWRIAQGENVFIGQYPRFLIEALGMVFIAILAYLLSGQPGGLGQALPVLGALAFGAQRLLPVMQQGYAAWTSISGSKHAFADTITLLEQPQTDDAVESADAELAFERAIELREVGFSYAVDTGAVLRGISLRIPKGACVGIVGSTGSGKSTLVDIIMGLLRPTDGDILIDNVPLNAASAASWHAQLAHVPQSIFLRDATIAENIAMLMADEKLDMNLVKAAARDAQIADFVEGLPEGYATQVGERGVRLSGGQRQRLGIARALYRKAAVLVLDEATSALDNETEESVMDAIDRVDQNMTILMIAHRLTTLSKCDTIIQLVDGKISFVGSYSELIENSASFRDFVKGPGVDIDKGEN